MRPILLKGHERSITHVRYSREGDLLFTASKAYQPNVWYSDNGERVGTYKGHNGSVWSLDVSYNTQFLATAGADSYSKLFDTETAKELSSFLHRAPVRWVSFCEGGKRLATVTDQVMGKDATINIYDIRSGSLIREINSPGIKIHQAHWGPGNRTIFATLDDCSVTVFDPDTTSPDKIVKRVQAHRKPAHCLSFSQDKTHFLTASADHSVKLFDTATLDNLKTYETEIPVNAAAISPLKDLILFGGGQSAETVTMSRADATQFKLRFYHKIFEKEVASISGHFGPVNTVAFAPDGSFASGGEDGFVRVHNLEDPSFFYMGDFDEYDDFDLDY